jgi:hypothetical protein
MASEGAPLSIPAPLGLSDTGRSENRMNFSKKVLSFFLFAGCCLAVRNPDWKLGTVLDSPALHQPAGIEAPVYSPDGKAIPTLPEVQQISLEGTQRLILGSSTAYIVDPGPNTGAIEVGHGLMRRDAYVCQLGVRDQVMYAEKTEKKGKQLEILDSFGRVCSLDIVREHQLLATAQAKAQ